MKKKYISVIVLLIIIISNIGSAVYGTNTKATRSESTTSQTETDNLTEEELEELEKEQEANKNLEYLRIDGYEMYPEFNKNTINYYVIIPAGVTSLDIEAEPEVEGAIVRVSGNTKLTKKENTIRVRVTAIDGTSRTYTITASREPEVNLKLSSLQIEGVNLDQTFDESTYYYTSKLEDTELEKLNVTAVANDPNAKIEIIGADKLENGRNLINVVVENDEETTIYQIDLDVQKKGEKAKEADNIITRIRKIMEYATIGIFSLIGIIILAIIITIIVKACKKHKKNKHGLD